MFTKLLPLKFTFVVNSENLDPESFITSLLSCRSFLVSSTIRQPFDRFRELPSVILNPTRQASADSFLITPWINFSKDGVGVWGPGVGGKNFGQLFNVNSRYKRVHKQINIYYIYCKHFSFLSLSSVFVLFHYNFLNYFFFIQRGQQGNAIPTNMISFVT